MRLRRLSPAAAVLKLALGGAAFQNFSCGVLRCCKWWRPRCRPSPKLPCQNGCHPSVADPSARPIQFFALVQMSVVFRRSKTSSDPLLPVCSPHPSTNSKGRASTIFGGAVAFTVVIFLVASSSAGDGRLLAEGEVATAASMPAATADDVTLLRSLSADVAVPSSASASTVSQQSRGSATEPVAVRADRPCRDKSAKCGTWAATGECSKNAKYMLDACPMSCGACSDSGGLPTATTAAPNSSGSDTSPRCAAWAAQGECSRNPRYMNANCQHACAALDPSAARGNGAKDES